MDLRAEQSRAIFASDRLGQIFGCALAIFFAICAIICAWIGQPWVAGVLAGIDIIAIIYAFRTMNANNPPSQQKNESNNHDEK